MATSPPDPAPSDPVRLAPLARQVYPVAPLPAALTTLIGREGDMERVAGLLAQPECRLLTLVGPGGVGKSRLALAVANVVERSYADGVVLVELAAVADPALVPLAIAQAIGVRERSASSLAESLTAALRPRRLLLILDNLEHLLESTGLIPHLLATCPDLTVLATSRAALHVSGERDVLINPLTVPRPDLCEHLGAVEASPAVQLFVARAQAVREDFALTPGNAAAIAEICRRLDGLPLAIELAAARTRHFPLQTLLKRMEFPLDLLDGGPRDQAPRLRTMRAAIAWSYDLLHEKERALFRRIAVLAGGGDEDAVLAVSAGGGPLGLSALDSIAALVDMSLLQMTETRAGEARYAMLETIREFGLERLVASGEDHAARGAHAAHFLAWAAQAEPHLFARGSSVWVERLILEWPNLRQAVAWALEQGEIEQVLRLAGTVLTLAYARGNPLEGEEWLEAALAASDDVDPGARVDALFTASALAQVRGDFAHSIALSETGLDLARTHEYTFGQARVLLALGITAEWQGDLDLAANRYELARELMASLDHPDRLPHWSLLPAANLADIALLRDDPMLAASHAEEAVAGWRTMDYIWGIAQALGTAAAAASAQGDQVRAARHFDETLTLWLDSDDGRGIAGTLAGIAGVANQRGQFDRAARLLGAAWGIAAALGVRYLAHHVHAERVLAATSAHLDAEAFATAWAEGQRLTVDEAVAEARRVLAVPAAPPAPLSPEPAVSLSPRELDVLRLLVAGNSDREIAAALRVSPRTVQTHVASLFAKFGVDSRVEVTAAAIRRGIV